jgi:hypothetical protein
LRRALLIVRIPAQGQEDLAAVAAASAKALGKAVKKSGGAAETQGGLWLALHTYGVWAGENNSEILSVEPEAVLMYLQNLRPFQIIPFRNC